MKKGKQRIIPQDELNISDRKVCVPAGAHVPAGDPAGKQSREDMHVEAIRDDNDAVQAIRVECPCGREVRIECVLEGDPSHEGENSHESESV